MQGNLGNSGLSSQVTGANLSSTYKAEKGFGDFYNGGGTAKVYDDKPERKRSDSTDNYGKK